MKFKLILVALLLAFLIAVSASAVSAADDATLESVLADDAIESGDNSEVLCDEPGPDYKHIWIDNSTDESMINVEGTMEVVNHKNPDVVALTGASASRNTTYSDNDTTSLENKVIEQSLNRAKMISGASDIEVTKIDRNVSSSMYDHRKYDSIVDDKAKTVTHITTGSYAKITNVKLQMVAEYNREDQKQIETQIIAPNMTIAFSDAAKGFKYQIMLKEKNGKGIGGKAVSIKFIDDVISATTDNDGMAGAVLTADKEGTYDVNVIFAGDDKYTSSNAAAKVTVTKLETKLTAKYDASSKNIVATVKDANGNPISGIRVGFDIDGMKYIVTEANGQAKYYTGGLAKKAYSVNVMAYGNEIYKDSNKETVEFDLSGISTTLSASDVTTDYNGGKNFTATLKDANGKTVKGAMLTVKIGSLTRVLYTDDNGQVSLSTNGILPDTYTATVTFDGDDTYAASNTTAKVTINKLDTKLTANYDAASKNIVATVKDANGNPVSGIRVGFDIDGMKYIVTEANGQAKYYTGGLAKKAYSVNVMAYGNEIYKDSNKETVEFDLSGISTTLSASDVTTDYNGGKNFTATLKDANGKTVKGAMLTVKIGSLTRVLYTDDNGQVSLSTNGILPDTYTATVTFDGDDTYAASNTTAKVTINKLDTKLTAKYDASSKNIVATVKDANGNPVNGVKVGFAIDGVKYATTDANGEAKYSTADLADGTYKVNVQAYGNEIYQNSNKETVTFTVGDKQQSKIFLRNALYFVTQTKMVKVTLWDANNKPLAGKTVHITLKEYGLKYSGVTDENGDALIRVGVGLGVHNATVSFDGDDKYQASMRVGNIRVIKETPSIMVRGYNQQFKVSDNPKIVKVYLWDRESKPLPVNSKVAIKIEGKTYIGYTDSQGIASISININKAGTYNAELKYAGNSAYNAVTRPVKFVVS